MSTPNIAGDTGRIMLIVAPTVFQRPPFYWCLPRLAEPSNIQRRRHASPLLLLLLLLWTLPVAGQLVSTLAGGGGATQPGSANGQGTAAAFNTPTGAAIGANGTIALIVGGGGIETCTHHMNVPVSL